MSTIDAPNPYTPPLAQDPTQTSAAAPEAPMEITFTAEPADLSAGLSLTVRGRLWILPTWLALVGFIAMRDLPVAAQLIMACVLAGIGFFVVWNSIRARAKRALANRTQEERTSTWRLTPDYVEVSAAGDLARIQWRSFHRFLEGRQSFVLYPSESMAQILPKRVLSAAQVERLRALFAARIIPRKQPSRVARIVVLWAVLVLAFLAIWQFLNSTP